MKIHAERLFALFHKDGKGATSMCYTLQPTARELWSVIVEDEVLGTGHTKETLMARGWRAKRVTVTEGT
jgi:predicted RNA-binding protein